MYHTFEFLYKEEVVHYTQYIHSEQVAHYKDHYLYNHDCLQIHLACNKDFEEETSFYITVVVLVVVDVLEVVVVQQFCISC